MWGEGVEAGAGEGEGERAGAGDVEGTGPTNPEKGLYLKDWCVEHEMMLRFWKRNLSMHIGHSVQNYAKQGENQDKNVHHKNNPLKPIQTWLHASLLKYAVFVTTVTSYGWAEETVSW